MKKRIIILLSTCVLIVALSLSVVSAFANSEIINPFQNEPVNLEKVYDDYIFEYTFFPSSLINHIGSEEFMQWIESSEPYRLNDAGEVIPRNIVDCLEYFNITQKEFDAIYYTYDYYTLIYDVDLMYNGTPAEIIEYFKDFKKREIEYDRRINIVDNKIVLRNNLNKWTNDVEVIQKYYELPITAWTFTDIIYDANIPRTDIEAIFDSTKSYDYISGNPKYNIYDLDKMYEAVSVMRCSEKITPVEQKADNPLKTSKEQIIYERQFMN